MSPTAPDIAENVREIRERVENVKAKYRSSDDKIEIMAVTKTVPPERVNAAVECGLCLLGENRVQEYLSKKDLYDKRAVMHFIGHLQTNKVKYIINDAAVIQSVDTLKLAREISRLALKNGRAVDILIEVNIGDEQSKSGVSADDTERLVREAAMLDGVRVKGLMAIPPIGSDESVFAHMHDIFLSIKEKNIDRVDMRTLSMGMSGDFELAVKHGSNLVRIGSRLFGARSYAGKG